MSSAGFFDCPTEIRDEILSYLPFDNPSTLQGLQLGLTCKTLYEILGPVIVKVQVERLLEAVKISNLQIHRLDPSPTSHPQAAPLEFSSTDYSSSWRSISEVSRPYNDNIHHLFHPSMNPGSECDFGITYEVMSEGQISSAVEEMWGLHSLLSRSQRFRRIRLYLPQPRFRAEVESTVGCQWLRAFLKLLEVCAERSGMEITVIDPSAWKGGFESFEPLKPLFSQEGTVHPESSTLSPLERCLVTPSNVDTTRSQPALQPIDFAFPSPSETFTTSQLSLLTLSGGEGVFSPSYYPLFHNLTLQSSSTLTRLHLNLCPLLPEDWRVMLSCWNFPQLSHFSIRESKVPCTVLVSFLRCHPTLTNVYLWVNQVDVQSTTALIDEEFLPNVRQMVAFPSLLIPILSSWTCSSGLMFELLPALEHLTISQEHDYRRGCSAAPQFEDISKVLSIIAARRCDTSLPKLHTLAIRTVYQAQAAFEGWLRVVTLPIDSSPSSSFAASASFPSIPNLPLRGISEFHISAYSSPYYDQTIRLCSVPTMNMDPNLVVDFVVRLFGDGGSTGLKKVVLSDIFTGCSSFQVNRRTREAVWRELDTFPPAIERIWGRCGDLEEVRLHGLGTYDLDVGEVWKTFTRPPGR